MTRSTMCSCFQSSLAAFTLAVAVSASCVAVTTSKLAAHAAPLSTQEHSIAYATANEERRCFEIGKGNASNVAREGPRFLYIRAHLVIHVTCPEVSRAKIYYGAMMTCNQSTTTALLYRKTFPRVTGTDIAFNYGMRIRCGNTFHLRLAAEVPLYLIPKGGGAQSESRAVIVTTPREITVQQPADGCNMFITSWDGQTKYD